MARVEIGWLHSDKSAHPPIPPCECSCCINLSADLTLHFSLMHEVLKNSFSCATFNVNPLGSLCILFLKDTILFFLSFFFWCCWEGMMKWHTVQEQKRAHLLQQHEQSGEQGGGTVFHLQWGANEGHMSNETGVTTTDTVKIKITNKV